MRWWRMKVSKKLALKKKDKMMEEGADQIWRGY